MKPIFTIHAGEYLVGSHIEETYKKARVWLPSKDTGIDLLVTNEQLDRMVSLQVKFSKDFLGNKGGTNAFLQTRIKAGGWWTFKYEKIENSPADLWVLGIYSAGIAARKAGRKGEPERALKSASSTRCPFFRTVEI